MLHEIVTHQFESTKLSNIRDILVSTATDKYAKTKQRLIHINGKTRAEQLAQLLQGANIPTNCKPSVTSSSIRHVASASADSDMKNIIHSMWAPRLSICIREMLAPNGSLPSAVQAEIADRLYVIILFEVLLYNNY